MSELKTLPASSSTETVLDVINTDGAVILKDMISQRDLDTVFDEVQPYMDATRNGADDFTGRLTTRTGALVARSAGCRDLIMNQTVLDAAKTFLKPYCTRFQLHLGQIIRLRPGQGAQQIHRDRWAWGTYLTDIEPQFNTIWAFTDFTEENGATVVSPGSIKQPDSWRPGPEELTQAVMSRGSALLYTGSVFHGGGANKSNSDRIGMNLTYSLAWLRQEENQFLSCPPDIARNLDPAMQDLLGYTLGSYALGYYTPPLPPGEGPESIYPEFAVGRTKKGEGLGDEELLEEIQASSAAAK